MSAGGKGLEKGRSGLLSGSGRAEWVSERRRRRVLMCERGAGLAGSSLDMVFLNAGYRSCCRGLAQAFLPNLRLPLLGIL